VTGSQAHLYQGSGGIILRILTLCVAILAIAVAPGWCGNVCTGDISELTDFGKLAVLRDSICTQVSSYDRTGGNDDGFSGKYSYIREENGKQVLFDADGPGCIYRLWSAMPNDQKIEFYFDGNTTAGLTFDSWKDMFEGKVYPFLPPFSRHFIGGWCSYIPIPFAKHLKIVTHGKAQFLQITWQKFASPDGVRTFSTNYSDDYRAKYEAAKRVWSEPGSAPWGESMPSAWKSYDVDVSGAPGKAVDLLKLPQAGTVRAMYLTIDNPDIRRYRKCVLEVWTDGTAKPNVYSPYGDFFLDGFGWPAGRSILTGKKDGQYYSYWPMPFANGIRIAMTNDTAEPLQIKGRIIVEPMASLPTDTGRFFAWWHRQNPTRMGKGFEMLTATGRGQFCGVNHLMQGPDGGVSYLEGDEMAWIDDRDNSYYNGTGTEDYFNGGWYFGALGSAPLYGCLAESDGGTVDAYRFQLGDTIPFQKKARIEIEHGSHNNYPIDLTGTTFWYAEPGTTHTFEPVAMADRLMGPRKDQSTFEAERAFQGGGPLVQITYSTKQLQFHESAVLCTASAPGGLIMCKMDADATSEYEIRAQVVCGPDCGIVQTLIDGKPVGEPVDCYSDATELKVMTFAVLTPEIHASGDHMLTFKVVGKSPKSKSYNMGVDSVYLSRPGIMQGENMKVLEATGKAEIEVTAPYGPGWSGDSQLQMTGKAGDHFLLEMSVEKTGRYNVGGYFAKGPNCGRVRVTLDNRVVENELDLYSDVHHREPLMRFGGEYDLAAGPHKLRIDILGKNPQSKGYAVGLDAWSLERVTPDN